MFIGLATLLASVKSLAAQLASPSTANPFSGFETHYLSNGVKVWFKHLEGASEVAVSSGVPVGRDADPPGRAQLSHFLEHMQFTDQGGRTEQQIREAIERFGGRESGVSYADHTWFGVVIPREHGLFAIEWLADILGPREMEPAVVERNRSPLIVELGARPRDWLERLIAWLSPQRLATHFWELELGYRPNNDSDADLWTSLHRTTPGELLDFYDRYYAPGGLTVTIVGDLDAGEALATAERTFGAIPPRPVHRWPVTLTDPGRGRSEYRWHLHPAHRYRNYHKLFNPSGEDILTGLFISDLLNHRLNQRIRWGERKAVYGVHVSLVTRGPGAVFKVQGDIYPEEYALATRVIEEEIDALRTGGLDGAEFERSRAVAVERLRADYRAAKPLIDWTVTTFYDPDIFTDFPDLVGFYEDLTPDRVAAFAEELFDPSRRVLMVTRASPLGPIALAAVALSLFGIVLGLCRWESGRSIRVSDIRYIARLRIPLALATGYTVFLVAACGIAILAGRAGFAWAADRSLYTIDSPALHLGVTAALLGIALAALFRILAWMPHEVAVANDHLRLQSRAWRSRILRADDIAEISTRDFRGAWLDPRILRSIPLAFGMQRHGIHLRPKRGRVYFFRTRNTAEFAEVLQEWWQEGRSAGSPGR